MLVEKFSRLFDTSGSSVEDWKFSHTIVVKSLPEEGGVYAMLQNVYGC
jgi:hypothetical protein